MDAWRHATRAPAAPAAPMAPARPGSHRPGSGRSLGQLGAKIGPQTARLPQTDRTDRGVLLTRRTHRGGHHPRPAQAAGRAVRAGQSLTNGGGWRTASPGLVPAGILAQFAHPHPVHRRTVAHAVLLVTTTPA